MPELIKGVYAGALVCRRNQSDVALSCKDPPPAMVIRLRPCTTTSSHTPQRSRARPPVHVIGVPSGAATAEIGTLAVYERDREKSFILAISYHPNAYNSRRISRGAGRPSKAPVQYTKYIHMYTSCDFFSSLRALESKKIRRTSTNSGNAEPAAG